MRPAERAFTRQVLALADRVGLLAHWCSDSRRCAGRGLPDVLVAGPRGVILAELKMPGGETSAEQDLWIWTLNQIGSLDIRVRVYRPAALASGYIEREFRSLI